MNCPHCNHALTDAELKRLWAQRNAKRQTPHAGPGRPVGGSAKSSYSMGKACTLCGVSVDNMTKVLTCQKCRHAQAQSKKESREINAIDRWLTER